MFGRMTVTPIVQVGAGADLQVAITTLLRAADQPEIARRIEFPNSAATALASSINS